MLNSRFQLSRHKTTVYIKEGNRVLFIREVVSVLGSFSSSLGVSVSLKSKHGTVTVIKIAPKKVKELSCYPQCH